MVMPAGQVYAEPVYQAPAVAVAPVYEPAYITQPPDRRWVAVAAAALLALLVGGIVGLLIGRSSAEKDTLASVDTQPTTSSVPADQDAVDQRVNDVFTFLAAEAKQPGGISTPTPYPALDELLGTLQQPADTSSTQATADTAATEALAADIATLQQQNADLLEQLATAQADRDDLAKQLADNGGSTSELQRKVDEQSQQITQLQNDAATTQSQLDTANATLEQLDPQPADDFVGMDIAKARDLAKSRGWVLVEMPIDKSGAPPNSVIAQNPAPGTTMIKGSLLIVEYAKRA